MSSAHGASGGNGKIGPGCVRSAGLARGLSWWGGAFGCLLGWVLAAASLARAADELPVTGPVIELPKFEVTDSRLLPPPEKWRYAEVPGFEVLSNVSSSASKRFMQDFMLLQEVIEILMPGLARGP